MARNIPTKRVTFLGAAESDIQLVRPASWCSRTARRFASRSVRLRPRRQVPSVRALYLAVTFVGAGGCSATASTKNGSSPPFLDTGMTTGSAGTGAQVTAGATSGAAGRTAVGLSPDPNAAGSIAGAPPQAGGGGRSPDPALRSGAGHAADVMATAGAASAVAGTSAPAIAGTSATSDAGRGAQQPSVGAGAVAMPTTPLDPSITFDWPETSQGDQSQSSCQPGTYVGTFNCSSQLNPFDPNATIEVTGPVMFTLTKSQNGEFLEISNGHLDGYAQLIINFAAALSGRLDCSTNRFDAMAVDGVYGLGDVNALPAGTFDGSLSGTLDPSTQVLSGEWVLTGEQGISCVGPWMATFMP